MAVEELFSRSTAEDEHFMELAYGEALRAREEDEVPVGALVVCGGKVLAREHNRVRQSGDPTGHGEMLALRAAARAFGDWRLVGCTLYTTKEPCPMCSGACAIARVDRVVFGVGDPRMGCLGGCGCDLSRMPTFLHRFSARGGVLADAMHRLLREFFEEKRRRGAGGRCGFSKFPIDNF
ncbi:MAG: nucleoside deaminase [Puniceicoccales bacterium]|jgi:tRNA(adenine34) deaminase|nr:nucleoside deaminase [Puniceicoccales bacterium]